MVPQLQYIDRVLELADFQLERTNLYYRVALGRVAWAQCHYTDAELSTPS